MPLVTAELSCPIHDSFRVRQVAGMFDVKLAETCRERFEIEIPDLSEEWSIGVIVGPSGSGKTSVARQAFGNAVRTARGWPADCAVVDCFGKRPIKEITAALTAVGFSSPPSWIKPYWVLSNGERFRCDLARALLSDAPLVVFDEFTSVVDRAVAQIGSAAVAKAVRGGQFVVGDQQSEVGGQKSEVSASDFKSQISNPQSAIRNPQLHRRFVAVTCHYDVLPWLAPDWVADMADGRLSRGRLRRPEIELEVFRCRRRLWDLFKRHHYLSGALPPAVECYAAVWRGRPVAFAALVGQYGRRRTKRISRLVTLPDYQGIGIGMRLAEALAQLKRCAGYRITLTASHPAVIRHCARSPQWRTTGIAKTGRPSHWPNSAGSRQPTARSSAGRAVASFEYQAVE
jgi:GNAT superfamily N-acetyltransferase